MHLEEIDVSGNRDLDPMQCLSRLIPGRCPKLRILKMNQVGSTIPARATETIGYGNNFNTFSTILDACLTDSTYF